MVTSVGDTPFDLEAGAAAGCGLVVRVMNGTHKPKNSGTRRIRTSFLIWLWLVIGRGPIPMSSGGSLHAPALP